MLTVCSEVQHSAGQLNRTHSSTHRSAQQAFTLTPSDRDSSESATHTHGQSLHHLISLWTTIFTSAHNFFRIQILWFLYTIRVKSFNYPIALSVVACTFVIRVGTVRYICYTKLLFSVLPPTHVKWRQRCVTRLLIGQARCWPSPWWQCLASRRRCRRRRLRSAAGRRWSPGHNRCGPSSHRSGFSSVSVRRLPGQWTSKRIIL